MILFGHYILDLRNRDHRQVSTKQQEQRRKQSETANQHHDVDFGRVEITPAGRQEVTTKRGDRDHESLEPHADVHKDANDHHEPWSRAAPLESKTTAESTRCS